MLGLVGRLNKTTVSSLNIIKDHQVKYILNLYPYLRYPSHRHQWGWIKTSINRDKSLRKKSFDWTISTGTARIIRGLPIQISRLIRTTYSAIYWHLCTTPLLQKITVVDRHVAIASRHLLLLLSQDLNLLDNWESLWHTQGAGQTGPAAAGEGEGATLWEMEERQLHERGTSLPRPKRTYSSCSGTKWKMEQREEKMGK